ncbi:MAG: hypothetical protein V1911_01560 [Candidatus Micrarchaeota archaeon]
MNKLIALLALLLLAQAGFATITVISPVERVFSDGDFQVDNKLIYHGVIDFGTAAPGQSIVFVFSRNTGEEGLIYWEKAVVSTDIVRESTLSGNEIELLAKMPENVRGEYYFNVTMEGVDIGTIVSEVFTGKIFIKEDVFDFTIPEYIESDAGADKEFTMTVKSSSIAPDTIFIKNMDGIASKWITMQEFEIGPLEQKQITVEVTPNEEGLYNAKFNIGRASGPYIDQFSSKIRVYPTLKSKLGAFDEGFSIIPAILEPFYALLGMLGLI